MLLPAPRTMWLTACKHSESARAAVRAARQRCVKEVKRMKKYSKPIINKVAQDKVMRQLV